MAKRVFKKRVVVRSIVGIVCVVLSIFVSFLFLLPVALILWLNHRELFSKKN